MLAGLPFAVLSRTRPLRRLVSCRKYEKLSPWSSSRTRCRRRGDGARGAVGTGQKIETAERRVKDVRSDFGPADAFSRVPTSCRIGDADRIAELLGDLGYPAPAASVIGRLERLQTSRSAAFVAHVDDQTVGQGRGL